jgi:hypothetical protein
VIFIRAAFLVIILRSSGLHCRIADGALHGALHKGVSPTRFCCGLARSWELNWAEFAIRSRRLPPDR